MRGLGGHRLPGGLRPNGGHGWIEENEENKTTWFVFGDSEIFGRGDRPEKVKCPPGAPVDPALSKIILKH